MKRRGFLATVSLAAGPYALGGATAWTKILQRGPKAAADVPSLFLDANAMALVAGIADGIIPTTDTPGASSAGVPQFISILFSDWFSDEEQDLFRKGLIGFDEDSRLKTGAVFVKCSAQRQNEMLSGWDKAAAAARREHTTLPFFARFKELTLIGYYTSRVGQAEELKTVLDAGEAEPYGPIMMAPPFQF